jgi:hypothetical protein
MDTMTQSEMSDLRGRSGLAAGFCTAITWSYEFNSLDTGDLDGWGDGSASDPNRYEGWLVMTGTGSNSGELGITIPAGAKLYIDVATTGACTYYPRGASQPGFAIPASTSFFSLSLTDVNILLEPPETVWINLSTSPGVRGGSEAWLDSVGSIKPVNVAIDKADMATSTLYVWAD